MAYALDVVRRSRTDALRCVDVLVLFCVGMTSRPDQRRAAQHLEAKVIRYAKDVVVLEDPAGPKDRQTTCRKQRPEVGVSGEHDKHLPSGQHRHIRGKRRSESPGRLASDANAIQPL